MKLVAQFYVRLLFIDRSMCKLTNYNFFFHYVLSKYAKFIH